MVVLGIDPGLVQTGFGLISISNQKIDCIDYGVIKPDKASDLPNRLLTIHEDVKSIISNYSPKIVVIEDVFYGKNIKSALKLGQARGSAMVAAASVNLPIYEYSARKIKQAITGNGNSTKEQIQFMVKNILNLKVLPMPIDASDALAIAICHSQQFREYDL
tara:strand:- start:670 stop:1152 length:483 start_codon:yes stop_codon:yes gene_type:complete